MTTRRNLMRETLSALFLVAIWGVSSHAGAYCLEGTTWAGYSAIPVYHTADLVSNVLHQDGTQWTESEFTNELQWVLQTMNFYSNSNMPPMYDAGIRPGGACTGEACRLANAIVIIPNEDNPSCEASNDGWPSIGCLTRIERHVACSASYYSNFGAVANWNAVQPMYSVLMHEIGHALGLWHSHEACDGYLACSTPPCSVMSFAVSPREAMTWYRDDVLGLQAIYGAPSYPYRLQKESADGASWYALTSAGLPPFQPLFGLSSSTTNWMFATYRDSATLPRAYRWDWGAISWADWGSSGSYSTQGSTGAAWDPAGYGYSSYLRDETQSSVAKHFGLARHTAGSAVIYSWTGASTRRHGVAMAHDPRVNARVQVWRGSKAQIEIQVVDGATFLSPWEFTDGTGATVQALDTPSIACGDTLITLNCIIAWAEPAAEGTGLHSHILRWMHFSLSRTPSWHATLGPIMSDGHIMFGTPMVSYRGPALATYPFEIAWVAQANATPQYATFTAVKGSASDAAWNWSTLVEHGPYYARMAAGLGTAHNDGELLLLRRVP